MIRKLGYVISLETWNFLFRVESGDETQYLTQA